MREATRPSDLAASATARLIRERCLSSEELVTDCLARIGEIDPQVRAWAHVDAEAAIRQARDRDARPATGVLHGVPVGIKDMIDTQGLVTDYHSPLYTGHRPARDAASVSILRSSGAVVLGKTKTVEFASLGRTPDTRNPWDLDRSPGGTSGGSAAAVAARTVAIAMGTQTGGSTIRPASYCGQVGMKPTFGLVSTEGIKPYATSLDTMGWVGRSVADVALMAQALGTLDRPLPDLDLHSMRIGLFKTPHWDEADPSAQDVLMDVSDRLANAGVKVSNVSVTPGLERLTDAQDTVMHWEGRAAYRAEYLRSPQLLHPNLRHEVQNQIGSTSADARSAYNLIGLARAEWETAIQDVDAVLTLAACGEAPVGLEQTGSSVFSRMFTALHGPNVTVPARLGEHSCPIGLQLVGSRFADGRTLAVAAALERLLGFDLQPPTTPPAATTGFLHSAATRSKK